MSGLDARYIPLGQIQEQFWSKLQSCPMAAGTLEFFHDNARTIPKSIYSLTGTPVDYSYADMGNTITLSSIGTVNDSLGNSIQCYIFPYIEDGLPNAGEIDLYYVVVTNSDSQFEFSVPAVPNISANSNSNSTSGLQNFIPNSQFLLGQLPSPGTISATATQIAYGGWEYIRSSNAATDTVTFPRFSAPLNGIPTGNPRYACRIASTVPSAGDTYKTLQIVFQDVNRFSDPNQQLTLYFEGLNNQTGLLQLNVDLYKNFGAGGSTPTTTPIGSMAFSNIGYSNAALPFFFGSNYGDTIGTANDDYFAIQIQLPPTITFDISLTDFALYLGNVDITAYPLTPDPVGPYINVQTFTSSGTYTPTNGLSYATIECWGGGAGGGAATPGVAAYTIGASAGGAGGYSRKTVSKATIGVSQVVTIGTGGAGGTSIANAIAGGVTSVGTLCIANGGSGGYNVAGPGGLGGAAGTGDIAAPGMPGGNGMYFNSVSTLAYGGNGGSTIVGAGGLGAYANTTQAVVSGNAIGYGAGGGGGAENVTTSTAASGGNGSPGYVIITEFIGA